jgi:hypothetical protein
LDQNPDVEELSQLCRAADIVLEDWTASIRSICKACSEGTPHQGHDQDLKVPASWVESRVLGFASASRAALDQVLEQWLKNQQRQLRQLDLTLA